MSVAPNRAGGSAASRQLQASRGDELASRAASIRAHDEALAPGKPKEGTPKAEGPFETAKGYKRQGNIRSRLQHVARRVVPQQTNQEAGIRSRDRRSHGLRRLRI